jgi:hypothetical protein
LVKEGAEKGLCRFVEGAVLKRLRRLGLGRLEEEIDKAGVGPLSVPLEDVHFSGIKAG